MVGSRSFLMTLSSMLGVGWTCCCQDSQGHAEMIWLALAFKFEWSGFFPEEKHPKLHGILHNAATIDGLVLRLMCFGKAYMKRSFLARKVHGEAEVYLECHGPSSMFHHEFSRGCLNYPIGSMCGIFSYIYHKDKPNVGKYTIHGSYGYWPWHFSLLLFGLLSVQNGAHHGSECVWSSESCTQNLVSTARLPAGVSVVLNISFHSIFNTAGLHLFS